MKCETSRQIDAMIEWGYSRIIAAVTPNHFRLPRPTSVLNRQLTPQEFYHFDQRTPDVQITAHHTLPLGISSLRFQYPSPYHSPQIENNTVYGVADQHTNEQARGALIFLHGHAMWSVRPLRLFAGPILEKGFETYYLQLPYHMRRAPRHTWDGEYALCADIEQTMASFRQAVLDVRALISWIEQERGLPVYLAGISLGSFITCMTAVVDPRLRGIVALLSGASLADLPFAGYQKRLMLDHFQEAGLTQPDLERYWALAGPGNWQPALSAKHILLLSGRCDPIVTPDNTRRLWRAWGQPDLRWYPCGHAGLASYTADAGRQMAEFLCERLPDCA